MLVVTKMPKIKLAGLKMSFGAADGITGLADVSGLTDLAFVGLLFHRFK